ncbi:hypothetical protein Tco_1302024 [Tanacetum coccineum]
MGDENPIRTLGDYSKPSHEGYMNTIELPEGNNAVPLRSNTTRTAKFRNYILIFQQHQGESLSEAWTRFKDLLQKFPHHGIDLWLKVQIFYDHVNPVTRRTIDQSAGGKLRDRNVKESWALLEDLTLYDNESWNDPRDFAKPVKAIFPPQDVPSTSDRRLIELENQVQHLMEAHLAPKQPVQVNKISFSCEICSGPHDTQYCMENPEQAFVDYASSRTDKAGVVDLRGNSGLAVLSLSFAHLFRLPLGVSPRHLLLVVYLAFRGCPVFHWGLILLPCPWMVDVRWGVSFAPLPLGFFLLFSVPSVLFLLSFVFPSASSLPVALAVPCVSCSPALESVSVAALLSLFHLVVRFLCVPTKLEASGTLSNPSKTILVTPTIHHGKVTQTLGLVANFMASQDANLSKFEAYFKQQQGKMTNKIDTVLKAITDRIMGALLSDTVKNPKLNVNSTTRVSSARTYPTNDPREEQEERSNPENIDTTPPSPPDPSISFITEKKYDDSHEEGPEDKGNATIEGLEVGYFDTFLTRSELAYHKYLMSGPIPSLFLRNPIITKGCPSNLKIPCNIGHVHVEKAYIDLNFPLNVMTRMLYNWIMRRKLDPREDINRGVNNFMRRIKGMHVFIENFTYVIDFMIVEDIGSIIDPRLSQVILGKPFC